MMMQPADFQDLDDSTAMDHASTIVRPEKSIARPSGGQFLTPQQKDPGHASTHPETCDWLPGLMSQSPILVDTRQGGRGGAPLDVRCWEVS